MVLGTIRATWSEVPGFVLPSVARQPSASQGYSCPKTQKGQCVPGLTTPYAPQSLMLMLTDALESCWLLTPDSFAVVVECS